MVSGNGGDHHIVGPDRRPATREIGTEQTVMRGAGIVEWDARQWLEEPL
jgi:hypothetical protein